MVNFRFHLVSLTAVFLALAAGITIGAGVVDRATVDQIERQLARVESNRRQTNALNDQLRTDLARWGQFSAEAGDRMVEGRLRDAGVFIIAMRGTDEKLLEAFKGSLRSAGSVVEGTLWFTGKWSLHEGDNAAQLAALLDLAPTTALDELRDEAVTRITSAWRQGEGGPLITALTEGAFIEFEAPAPPIAPLAQLPTAGAVFVVVSSDTAEVPAGELAQPLVAELVSARIPVLAAQPSNPSPDPRKPAPPDFVTALRADRDTAPRLSSVDNLDDYRGRVAAVLAIQRLLTGRTGHYGFAPDAQRLLPEPAP